MGLFSGLIEAVEAFVTAWGLPGAFLIALTESFIFPVPTATIIAPMTAFGIDPLAITLVATAGSVIGALVGYFLGKHLGHPVAVKLFKQKRIDRIERWFDRWGPWAVFLAAFTFVPFKVFTWCAGIFEMRLRDFIIPAVIGRLLQFAIAAYVGSWVGPEILVFFGAI